MGNDIDLRCKQNQGAERDTLPVHSAYLDPAGPAPQTYFDSIIYFLTGFGWFLLSAKGGGECSITKIRLGTLGNVLLLK